MKTTYSCIGNVRGDCGHKHRTLSGARKCLERDQSGCESQGGYSDRYIIGTDCKCYSVDGSNDLYCDSDEQYTAE